MGELETSGICASSIDVNAEGVIVRAGADASRDFGFAPAALVGRAFEEVFHARDAERARQLLRAQRDTDTLCISQAHAPLRTVALRRVPRDGVLRFFVIDVSILGERAYDYDRFFEISYDLVCTAGMDGYFERVSRSFSELLGYDEAELLGRPILEFVHPEDREPTDAQFDLLADQDACDLDFTNRYLTREGRVVWLQWASRLDPESGLVYALARDVTGKKDLAAKLVAAREEAERASSAKSSFLASMSHELRTPLNAIIGYSEMIVEETEDPRVKADVEHIRDAGHQLLQLINGILDLSKIEAGRLDVLFDAIELDELIAGVVTTVAPMMRNNHNVFVRDIRASGRLLTDRRKLHQILLNLLSNAAKFTERGEVALRVYEEGANLRFVVQDTGVGMNEAGVRRMFEPFGQGAPTSAAAFVGTGLGIPITARFCEALGIAFQVESARGEGTTISLTVPRAPVIGSDAERVTGGYLLVRDVKSPKD